MGRNLLMLGTLVIAACGGSPRAVGDRPPPTSPAAPAAATPPTSDEIVADFAALRPRLHAIYRGRIDVEMGAVGQLCASALDGVDPPGARGPGRLCTPLAEVVAWQAGHAASVPQGGPLWIATTRDDAGRERIAAATSAAPAASAPTADDQRMLAEQYRCGQLALRWRIPDASLACARDADCRLFESTCFAAAVATRDAAPYEELFRRWGGTCVDPAGGDCAPAAGVACVDARCRVSW